MDSSELGMEQPMPPLFVEEIDFASIELFEVVGKGTFGTVKKGKWRDKDVAVKLIETEPERKAFLVEVRQLSRIDHPNIVKLHGACTKTSKVCLVMEYAEGGSLYNVLHRMRNTHYTAAHAVSWALQCASGVAYLHNMKPKALIHRDLKPPNMLLILNGTVLKICDFGTACDVQTIMTNSKGSAAWMAPEVFEGSRYSEKCDVFSWGIILWEVLTRKQPFDNIGGPAFRIMWAVHSGSRPPLISGCPGPLEELMTSCWARQPSDRPSMSEVEHKLRLISRFFKGADQPITVLPDKDFKGQPDSQEEDNVEGSLELMNMASVESGSSTYVRTSILPEMPQAFQHPPYPGGGGVLAQMPSPVGKRDSPDKSSRLKDAGKRKSADLSSIVDKPKSLGHRRSGSWGTPQQPPRNVGPILKAGSRESLVPPQLNVSPRHSPSTPLRIDTGYVVNNSRPSPNPNSGEETPVFSFLNAHLLLEPKFKPLPPAPNCSESLAIYESHCRLAQEYLKVQTEMEFIKKRREELSQASQKVQFHSSMENLQEFVQLQNDKEGLVELRKNLKKQLEYMKAQRNVLGLKTKTSDEWVMI